MTREEAVIEIEKAFEPAFVNYIITALTEGATVSDKEPTTKNDLAVDCISRTQAQTKIEMNASRYTISKERCGIGQVEWSDQLIKVSDAVDIIRNLPSITPREPILGKIYADIQRLRGCSCSCSDGIIDDIEDILDQYKAEKEVEG